MNQSATLLQGILDADDGAVVRQLAQQYGLSEEQVAGAARSMVPAFARGLEREAERPDGMDSLARALQTGDHRRYVDDPALLSQSATVEDGNKILGHVLGSKDVSRNVAGFASEQTGISSDVLKKLLPVLGAVAMGVLAKQMAGGGGVVPGGAGGGSGGGLMDILGGFLDTNKDGSMMDDLLNMAQNYIQKRG